MVSALHPGESGLGFSLGGGHCVVFLAKTHNCRSASLHTDVHMDTSEFHNGGKW